jgi:hypothetical protein
MEEYGFSQGLSEQDLHQGSDVEHFRSSLHNMELQLARVREQKALLENNYEEVKENLEKLRRKNDSAEATIHEQTKKIKDLEFKAEKSSKVLPQGTVDLLALQQQIQLKDEEISELKRLLKKKDSNIEMLKTSSNLDDHRLKALTSSVLDVNREKTTLVEKVSEFQKKLDSSTFAKRNEAVLQVEIEHYKADNARLLELLRASNEFKTFAEFAEASEGVRYLPRTNRPKVNPSEECDDWVPSESWKMVKDFLAKYGEKGFKSVQINRLLEDLNAIWRRREKNLMSQVRSKCNRELEKLRRQLANAPGYDQFVAEKEINRLKGDLKKANEDLRTVSSASVRAVGRPHGFI